ncbi:MAG: hypothetical protein GXP15_15385 [Gammaproteobacteria bacterium]|nr:hypothetical protein [Gammaproteobacteria bacterium]
MDFTQTQSHTMVGGQPHFAVPLIVAVTGHRDLVDGELAGIRATVRRFLKDLLQEYPDRGVSVMTALAEGADQLVAEEALHLGIPLIVPLPMQRKLYLDDFGSTNSRERFEMLSSRAAEIYELPVTPGNSLETIRQHGGNRDLQYAQLGVFLCAHCHILLALWDGKDNDKLGGTAQVVRFHHDDVMPGYTPDSTASGFILADDESDLVYHIVCSRDRRDGQPATPYEAGNHCWFSLDEDSPRSSVLPERHRRVFQYTSEFSRDAVKYTDKIRDGAYPLLSGDDHALLRPGLRDIDHVFRAADWLAVYFQKRMLFALQATHLLALLMGMMYIAYSDIFPTRYFLYAFLAFFLLAASIHAFSNWRSWHRKYLDYRTLAEGLRVQLYWAAAGVSTGNKSKFAHDNFLQTQDPDLGWIRNVMRVAGTECDASDYDESTGLRFTMREWLGDDSSGQLGYFRRKLKERLHRFRRTERMTQIAFWAGFAVIFLFILVSAEWGDVLRDPVVVLMGIMLLLVGVRQSYAFSIADAELIKQYTFMQRIFGNARRRIDATHNDDEKRRILHVLGEAALGEHAQWITMHRERSLEQGEIFRMSG